MNLAAWKYRNILSQDHGPVQSLESVKLDSPYLGAINEAYATLDTNVFTHPPKKHLHIYGSGDGTGTDVYQNVAQYKAISEALERWAFYEVSKSAEAEKFGFHKDASSTGMAAYPSLTQKPARQKAFYEAIERWCLCAWWEGQLRSAPLTLAGSESYQGIRLLTPWAHVAAVILWSQIPNTDFICYGFSCAADTDSAQARALVELDRNRRVLNLYLTRQNAAPVDSGESRLVYFAKPDGHQSFLDQVHRSNGDGTTPKPPPLIVDAALTGRWSQYTCVWRCLFEPIGDGHGGTELNYFLF